MEFTRVQILPLDRPTANGRIYPRGVVQEALAKLANRSLAVTHVNSFLDNDGAPKVGDSLGLAKEIGIDDATNMVMATIKIDQVPEDLKGGYVVRSAGFGELNGNIVTEFTMTGVVLGRE